MDRAPQTYTVYLQTERLSHMARNGAMRYWRYSMVFRACLNKVVDIMAHRIHTRKAYYTSHHYSPLNEQQTLTCAAAGFTDKQVATKTIATRAAFSFVVCCRLSLDLENARLAFKVLLPLQTRCAARHRPWPSCPRHHSRGVHCRLQQNPVSACTAGNAPPRAYT